MSRAGGASGAANLADVGSAAGAGRVAGAGAEPGAGPAAAPGPGLGDRSGRMEVPFSLDDTLSPDDLEYVDRLFLALAHVNQRLRRDAPTALSHGAVVTLSTVAREGPLRLGDLASAEGVSAPTMSRIVDGLVEGGFVERVPDPADRRACLVRATGAGEAALHGARTARSQILAVRVESLPADLRAELFRAIPALEALGA